MNSLVAEIKVFLSIQEKLTKALLSKYPECTNYSMLFNLPKHGEIYVNDRCWSFRKHGAGVEFSSVDNGTIVDVCERINQPNLFDEWRLSLYFESIHKEGSELKGGLSELIESGLIQRSEEHPKLLRLT